MESLESNLLALLKLRQKGRSIDLDEADEQRLVDLEREIGKYSGMVILDTITRPGVPGTIWSLIR